MALRYKKYGVTTGGYRGERAVLDERVIEGFEKAKFTDLVMELDESTPKTIYLTNENTPQYASIILPDAQTLWLNWQITLINMSQYDVDIYYFADERSPSSFYKTLTAGNMATLMLVDNSNSSQMGEWLNYKTEDQSNIDLLDRYTSDVLQEYHVTWNQIQQSSSSVQVALGSVLATTSLKSVYVKTSESFTGSTSLSVSIGTATDPTKFISNYDLMAQVSDTNFTKDLFDEILSTSEDTNIIATFSGEGLNNLSAGSVRIVLEKAKIIDPTVLKNPIVQTQLPIGVIMNYAFNDLPSGYWRLDGSLFPNAVAGIPDFVNKLTSVNNSLSSEKLIVAESEWWNIYNTYGSCPKFSWVGGSLRFPAINHFIRGVSDLSQLSRIETDTMRPITGSIQGSNSKGIQYPGASGALQALTEWQTHNGTSRDGRTTLSGFVLNSGLLGANYNGAETQPKNIRFPYIISIYNKIHDSSSLIVDEIIEASVLKANVSLDNLSPAGVSYLSNAILSNRSLGANGFVRVNDILTIQWGWFFCDRDNVANVSFPIPFRSQAAQVCVTYATNPNTAGNKRDTGFVADIQTTYFTYYSNNERSGANYRYIAIGY